MTASTADLIALTKPRITFMVVLTAAAGIWLAPAHTPLWRSFFLILGTTLVVCSANTMNMYIEREIDGRMRRTRRRPLPAGRMRPVVALWFGAALGLLSLPLLYFGVNLLTCLLGILSFVLYVCIYTPMKQRSPLALLVGAIPGAMPPLMGWTAATGKLEWPGVVLFGILFLWQIPHYLAITLYRTEEMVAAGYKVTAAQKGIFATKLRVVLYLMALVPVSLLLGPLHVAGPIYLTVAALSGAVFFGYGVWGLRRDAGARWARSLFQVSLLYIMAVSMGLLAGRLWGPG